MEIPKYRDQKVLSCLAHMAFQAWFPLMATCGPTMVAL